MPTGKILHPFSIIIVLAIAFLFVHAAHAHGGEPRLEISVERMNPGGVVDLRGADFEPEETSTLMLVNAKTAIPLGEIVADTEGVFLQIITLPVDLPEGVYNFLAITDDLNITSPDLIVQGPPILSEGGGQGLRDEDDPLLAPMPTFPPGVVPDTTLEVKQAPAPKSEDSRAGSSMIVVIALVALVFGAILFVLRTRKG